MLNDTPALIEERQRQAAQWFEALRDQICAVFSKIEADYSHPQLEPLPPGQFVRRSWSRDTHDGTDGGGGVMSVMKGRIFEKVGVNISTVFGTFNPEFAKSIPGTEEDPHFFATGISLVAHPRSPLVPAVHMNTRFLCTRKSWFGGGADLNPSIPNDQDTQDFHNALRAACDRTDTHYYPKFKHECDTYFFIKHRNRARGVGGIFYDYLDSGHWEADFAFTKDVGTTFAHIYPELVRRHIEKEWTPSQRDQQLAYRGLYTEFNLIYDRGTAFGLKTGGNVEAILMSLPPIATWD